MPMEWRPVLCHGQEWPGVSRDIGKEISQVINESNEALDVIVVAGFVPVSDAAKFVRICMNTVLVDNVAQAIYPVSVEVTLRPLKI